MKGDISLRRKNIWWWFATNVTLHSVASIRRKFLKMTHAEERSIHANSVNAIIDSDRKKIHLISNKSFRYFNQ